MKTMKVDAVVTYEVRFVHEVEVPDDFAMESVAHRRAVEEQLISEANEQWQGNSDAEVSDWFEVTAPKRKATS